MFRSKWWVSLLAVLIFSISPAVDAWGPADDTYLYPIAARANGEGGTMWKTELCFFNPWAYEIRINIGLFQDGDVVEARYTDVGSDETVCFPDIFASMGVGNGSGFMLVYSDEEDEFFTTSRIYNDAATGEYGQNVPPCESVNANGGILYGDVGVLTGVKNYGSPGVSGARTNVGFVNITDSPITVAVSECDSDICLNYQFTLGPYTVDQKPMKKTLTIGTIAVAADDIVVVYASTVDNKSGDAVFQGHRVFEMSKSTNSLPLAVGSLVSPKRASDYESSPSLDSLRVKVDKREAIELHTH